MRTSNEIKQLALEDSRHFQWDWDAVEKYPFLDTYNRLKISFLPSLESLYDKFYDTRGDHDISVMLNGLCDELYDVYLLQEMYRRLDAVETLTNTTHA